MYKKDGRKSKRHQKISGEVGYLERTKDGTNKCGTFPKGLTSAKIILNLPGGLSFPYYRSDEIK